MLKKIFFLFLLQVSFLGNMFAMKSSQISDSDSKAGDTIRIMDEGTMIVHEEESDSAEVDFKEYKPVVYGNKGRGRRDSNNNKMALKEFIELMNENENSSIEEGDNKEEQMLNELEALINEHKSTGTLSRDKLERSLGIYGTLKFKRDQTKENSGQTLKSETPCSILEELENDYASQPKQSFLGWVYSFLPEMLPKNKDAVLVALFPEDEEQPAPSWLGWAFSWVGFNPDQ